MGQRALCDHYKYFISINKFEARERGTRQLFVLQYEASRYQLKVFAKKCHILMPEYKIFAKEG